MAYKLTLGTPGHLDDHQELISPLTFRFLGKIHVGIEWGPEALCVSSQWHSLLRSPHLKGPETHGVPSIHHHFSIDLFVSIFQTECAFQPGRTPNWLTVWNTLRNYLFFLHLDFFPMVMFSLKGARSSPAEPSLFPSPEGGRRAVSGTLGFWR